MELHDEFASVLGESEEQTHENRTAVIEVRVCACVCLAYNGTTVHLLVD